MSSVPMVLSWEMFRRGRYSIPAFAFLANLFPLAINRALLAPVLPADDEARILMHVAFYPFIAIILSIGVITAQGRITRLYAAPLSNQFLVFWHMASGAIVLALLVAGSLALQNFLFSLGQGVLGPACLTVSLWAAGTGLIHLSHRTFFRTLQLAMPAIAVLWWGFSRYGSWTQAPREYWISPTASELFVILIMTGLSYLLHLELVRRDRCGDFRRQMKFAGWLERLSKTITGFNPIQLKPNATPAEALFWQNWSTRGLYLPALAVAYMIFFAVIIVLQFFVPNNAIPAADSEIPDAYLLGGLFVFSVASAMFGFVTGSLRSNRPRTREQISFADSVDATRSEVMGSFLATRPVRDSQISATILKSAAASVLLSGLIFWVGLAVVCGLQWALRGSSFRTQLLTLLDQKTTVLVFAGWLSFALPWLLIANSAVVMMTGRETKLMLGITSAMFIGIFTHSPSLWGPDSFLFERITDTGLGLVALTCIAAITWSFFRAGQNSMLSVRWIVLAVAVWMAQVLGLTTFITEPIPGPEWLLLVLVTGLVVFPLAAAPLAVQWNRHR